MTIKYSSFTMDLRQLFTLDNAIFTVSALLCGLPLLLSLLYIKLFGVNVPYGDEWEIVPLIDKLYVHSLTFGDLFAQHNEHRLFFPHLILLTSAYFTRYDAVAEMYISLLIACGTLALLFIMFQRQSRSLRRTLLIFIPVSWMFFNFNQWENILWGFQVSVYLCIFALVASLFLLEYSERPGLTFLLSIVFAIVSSFSFANGLMSWPAGLFLILASKAEGRWKLVVPWTIAGIAAGAAFFYGWSGPPNHPSWLYPFLHPGSSVLYAIALAGGTITSYSYAAIAVGVAIIVALGLVIWLVAKYRAWKENGFWLSLVLFALLTALLCVIGRSGIGVTEALSSRYITLIMPGLLGVYAMACALIKKMPAGQGRFILFSVMLILMVTSILAGYIGGFMEGKTLMDYRTNTIGIIKNFHSESDEALTAIYPYPVAVRDDIRTLEKYHLSVFS